MTGPMIEMIESLLCTTCASTAKPLLPPCFAIGFTLTKSEPTGRDLIDRVQDITRVIMKEATSLGYDMKHVGDDPVRYGVDPTLRRKHKGTCTTWVVLLEDC
mmetsp:Transcript_39507/g.86711  ORF Transcript_39507/g.86711 Transcript_39507/m.86711 type:complete len:102 (+) Transcript_39507:1-306(+)